MFKAFNEYTKKPAKNFFTASGYDHFFKPNKDDGSFFRLRVDQVNKQLTYKKKLTEDNNVVRTEYNIDLAKNITDNYIINFCRDLGYEYTKSIFKNSFIYEFEWYILSYYICYDGTMTELGRFIEIEVNEDMASANPSQAYADLLSLEKLYKNLGLKVSTRVSSSLYELFGGANAKEKV